MTRAVGVLGGSFDPVHRGHVALGERALRTLGLERVLFVPSPAPPHKPLRSLAASYHRLEMIQLALEGRPGLGMSTIEIARGGVPYTIDTLRALRRLRPEVPLVFVCGGDAMAEITSWRDHEALLAEFDFAAATRPGVALEPLRPHAGARIFTIDMPPLSISSSLVRARCASGSPIDDLVPARVARYIQRQRLYREEAAS